MVMVCGRNVIGVVVLFLAVWNTGSADIQSMVRGLSQDQLENLIREYNIENQLLEDTSDEDVADYRLDQSEPNYDDYYNEDIPEIQTRSDPLDKHQSVQQPASPSAQPATAAAAGRGGNSVLPAYCDPPNPCPVGYDSNDGCIDDFENSSEFSREYQSTQNCLCDSEHMFNCPEDNVPQEINESPFLAHIPGLTDDLDGKNPYMSGQKLPIAAKKGNGWLI